MCNGTGWQETFLNAGGKRDPNGDRDTEQIYFDTIAAEVKEVVRHASTANGRAMRGNHAKILAGFIDATFKVAADIPADLQVGFLQPDQEYKAYMRFSNASSIVRNDDAEDDLRGVAIRIQSSPISHDFLMTNAEKHHAVDAREAMITIMAGMAKDRVEEHLRAGNGPLDRFLGEAAFLGYLATHLKHLDPREPFPAIRIADTLKTQMARKVSSLANEIYWSRAPLAIGTDRAPGAAVAVKYRLAPTSKDTNGNRHDLATELAERIAQGEVKFRFEVQRYCNHEATPIENATIAWSSELQVIGELTIPKGAQIRNDEVDSLRFNPWNVDLTFFQPLGSMNRSRNEVYQASASLR